ncbi:MAG: AraC-like DNA-binding protein [Crocinitomicaceae bacterium]|jgi:AraC-like DNA-binding protein
MAFNGRFVLNMAHHATKQGGDLNKIIAITGKSIEELNEESCVVDDLIYNKVVELAVGISGDNYFGLHAGENLNLSAAGLIVQLTQTSETVKQAIELCCEYANLGCSALPLSLVKSGDVYRVILTPNQLWKNQSAIAFQHTTEGVLAFTIKEYSSLTRMQHNPVAVHLTWSKPSDKDISEYERVFGCSVLFNQDEIAIVLKEEQVEEKVVTSNYDLLKVLITHATEKSAQISKTLGFVSLVKQSMLNLIKPEFPSVDQVAGHLNVSSRTLQRKLKEEGKTYKELIDELRLDFALGYLNQPELQISEIAYLLSYADASAFNRSFKRWTGKTPSEHRQKL